ncbi:MAG TPA: hypothetical protein VIX91_16700 [Candidatus Acidoferrum sp.]
MPCIPVSVILPPPLDSAFGVVAERIIGMRFLDSVGRRAKGFFPGSPTQEDFQDISVGPFTNTKLYILYLKFHNSLSVKQLVVLTGAGLVKVPDLLTHNPPRSRKPSRAEVYEIKPLSPTGLTDGAAKLAAIRLLYATLGVPYKLGTVWSPDEKILLSKGDPLGVHLEVYFHFQRISPGLIVYDICIAGELEKIALAVLLAILAIILALILKGVKIPIPMPDPVPVPVA